MGNIPLPALDVRPPAAPPNPLEEFARVAQIRSQQQAYEVQQQDLQIKQQQAQDLEATTKAMQEWNPSSGDYDGLAKNVLKYGGSANAATAIQQHGLDIQTKTAALSEGQRKAFKEKHQALGDTLGPLVDEETVPDNELHQQALNWAMDQMHGGNLDQQTAQQYIGKIQTTPDAAQLRPWLDQERKIFIGQSAIAGQKKEQAQTEEATAKAREANATALLKEIETKGLQGLTPQYVSNAIDKVFDPNGANTGGQNRLVKAQALAALQRGDLPGAKQALQEGFQSALGVQKDVAVATNPQIQAGKVAVATAEGQARANVGASMARGSNAAVANVPPHLIPPATAAATKAGEDYAQSKSVSDRLQAIMQAARSGNVVSYQLLPEEGALQVVTAQGIHRINMAEIQNYGGGSAWQRLQGHIGKALTGESIPKSVLDDMGEMQKIMSEGSETKYHNALKTINDTYGAQFKPVEMETMTHQPAKPIPKPPNATHFGFGTVDKKKHWLDANGKDVGLAE